jgi:hypothetical protein
MEKEERSTTKQQPQSIIIISVATGISRSVNHAGV